MDSISAILTAQNIIDKTLGAAKTTSDVLLLDNGNISFTAYDMYFYSIDTQEMFPPMVYTNKFFSPEDFKEENQQRMVENILGQIYNPSFESFMLNIYHKYRKSPLELVAKVENMQDIDIYQELFNLKADDGIRVVSIPSANNDGNCYPFMFFNGIVKLNKGDKIDLEIFNYDQMHRINALHLYKKKLNNVIHVYYNTLIMR